MLKNKHLKEWAKIVSYHFPHLSLPEAAGLATWSFGMVITSSSSLTRVSEFIGRLNQEKTNTVKQRLKEWYLQADAKTGKKRNQLEVNECFAPLLKWILSLWNSEEKGAWKPHWQELFQSLKDVVPPDWQVVVSSDRGLYADWLFEAICALNWHPFLRINHQGTYQIRGEKEWQFLETVVPNTGMSWSGIVTCFKTNPLNCTLLACWDDSYKEPWLIYRDMKSDGWQWHKTRLREPSRAERLWLAMSVATIWTLTIGTDTEQHTPNIDDEQLPTNPINKKTHITGKIVRQISCFLQGLINIIADLLNGKAISLTGLFPQQYLTKYTLAVNTS
jgi:hypothetical protein